MTRELPAAKPLALTPDRATLLERNAAALAHQLRDRQMVVRNWTGKPEVRQGNALRNDWGLFSFTAVEQPQTMVEGVDFLKSWRVHHYLLQGVFTARGDVAAQHDFPVLIQRIAYHLGAVNPVNMRGGIVVASLSTAPVQLQRALVVSPMAQNVDEVFTVRWEPQPV
jgi:hypothetical protein